MKRLLLILAATVAALSLSLAQGGRLRGVEARGGEVELEPDGLHVPAGVRLELGEAPAVAVEGTFGAELNLWFGEPTDPDALVAHLGPQSALLDRELRPRGDNPAFPFLPGRRVVELTCGGTLTLSIDGEPRASMPAEPRCAPRVVSLRSAEPMVVHGIELDGAPITVSRSGLSWEAALLALVVVGGLLWVVPAESAFLLVLTPLIGLSHRFGLDPRATWAVVVAAVAFDGARRTSGGRRAVAGAVAGALVLGAVVLVARPIFGPVQGAPDADPLASGTAAVLLDYRAAEGKVQRVLDRIGPRLQERPTHRRLVVVLGSSSSGGGMSGGFWPDVLQVERPDLYVVSAAEGGATSWHMRKVVQGLPTRPDLCIAYLGHNDTLPSFPGLSLAELEGGLEPRSTAFVPPVSREEARENFVAMVAGCQRLLAMQEHARGREPTLASYAAMLREVPGLSYADGAAALAAAPPALTMIDDVHPTPSGQALLGRFVAERTLELLPR